MWIQAAITMAMYDATAAEALAASEWNKITSSPFWPPNILNLASEYAHNTIPPGTKEIIDNDSGNPHQLAWWFNWVTEITDTLNRDFGEFAHNPMSRSGISKPTFHSLCSTRRVTRSRFTKHSPCRSTLLRWTCSLSAPRRWAASRG